MREILFRGKRIDNGEWVEGKNIFWDTENRVNIVPTGELCFLATHHETLQNVLILPSVEVDPRTVGQYTGLTDKNGTKIFEGDIVKAEINGGPYDKFVFPVGVIAFENGCFGNKDRNQFTPLSSYAPRVSFEVIGNIHDNPELLKGESDNA